MLRAAIRVFAGVFLIVCNSAGALAQSEMGVPPPQMTVSSTGVNLFSGAYNYSHLDLSIGDLDLVRTYAGGEGTRSKFFGQRWSHNYDMYVYQRWAPNNERFAHVMIAGDAYSFHVPGLTQTLETVGSHRLAYDSAGDRYTFVDRDSILYTFSKISGDPRGNDSWSVTAVDYPSGKRLDFLYNGSGKLKAITSNTGHALVFMYGTNGYVSQACAYNLATTYVNVSTTCTASALKTSYGYSSTSSSALLTSAADVLGQTQTVSYAPNRAGHLRCVTDFGTANCPATNIYDGGATTGTWPAGFVTSQTLASGETVQYSYMRFQPGELDGLYPWEPWIDGTTTMTDPAGNKTNIAYDRSRPMTWGNSSGRGASYEYYWKYSDPSKITLPEGNAILFTTGASLWTEKRLRDKTNNSALDLVATRSYPTSCSSFTSKRCMKPDYETDFKGQRTDYTYHDPTGNVATETRPTVNGVRPQKWYTYQQRYAGVKNSSGAIVPAATPVWLLVEDSECKTQASCAGTADEVRTVYEYGPSGTANALRLRGKVIAAGSLNLRTCYGYDGQGNKISETTPNANLTSCP